MFVVTKLPLDYESLIRLSVTCYRVRSGRPQLVKTGRHISFHNTLFMPGRFHVSRPAKRQSPTQHVLVFLRILSETSTDYRSFTLFWTERVFLICHISYKTIINTNKSQQGHSAQEFMINQFSHRDRWRLIFSFILSAAKQSGNGDIMSH